MPEPFERSNADDSLRHAFEAAFSFALDGSCQGVNAAAGSLFGYACEDLLGFGYRTLEEPLGDAVFPADGAVRERRTVRTTYRHARGASVPVERRMVPVENAGALAGYTVFMRDLSTEAYLQRRLDAQSRRLSDLCAIGSDVEFEGPQRVRIALAFAMDALGMEFGYAGEFVLGQFRLLVTTGEAPAPVRVLEPALAPFRPQEPSVPGWPGHLHVPTFAGGVASGAVGFFSRAARPSDEADRRFVQLVGATISGIFVRERELRKLERLAYSDTLTGMANRERGMLELARQLKSATRDGSSFAVHIIDLDGFKAINDCCGHATGDRVLQEAGRRLRSVARDPMDLPARVGGDEFVVLQANVKSRSDALALGRRTIDALSAPYDLGGHCGDIGASIGVAMFPDDGCDAGSLMASADAALYRAKANGKRRMEFAGGDPLDVAAAAGPDAPP